MHTYYLYEYAPPWMYVLMYVLICVYVLIYVYVCLYGRLPIVSVYACIIYIWIVQCWFALFWLQLMSRRSWRDFCYVLWATALGR